MTYVKLAVIALCAMVSLVDLAAQAPSVTTARVVANDYYAHDIFTTGAVVPFSDTGESQAQFVAFPGGFTFPFYGQAYDGVWVNSWGCLQFGAASGSISMPGASVLPAAGAPGNAIFGCLAPLSLFPSIGYVVRAGFLSGPDRYVVHYKAMHTFGSVEFAVVLFTDGAIEAHFGPGTTLSIPANELRPGIGVQNEDATLGLDAPGGFRQTPDATTAYRWWAPEVNLDVVDVSTAPDPAPAGENDVHVTIANLGVEAYSGTVNVGYRVDGGSLVVQAVPVTELAPGEEITVEFSGASAWQADKGYYALTGAITPPVAGDPDTVDELTRGIHVGAGSWSQAPAASWLPRTRHATTVHDGRLWVVGGMGPDGLMKDVWSSVDGESWTLVTDSAPWPERWLHTLTSFDGRLWVMGGRSGAYFLNDVWSSSDGIEWIKETGAAPWPVRIGHAAVAFDGRLWVMGGNHIIGAWYGDVWSSSDGVQWTEHTTAAGWGGRTWHTATVFQDRIWVVGGGLGFSNGPWFNDVWSSADGMNWVRETEAADWPIRDRHAAVVFADRLWVLGGFGAGAFKNDVWSSSDGVQWFQEPAAAWEGRDGFTAAVFDHRIWVLGEDDHWSYIEAPSILSTPPATALVGHPYAYAIEATGAVAAADLPEWLTLEGSILHGTPGTEHVGTSGLITVTASNSEGATTQVFQIEVVTVAPSITSAPPTSATVGQPYSYAIQAQGAPPPTLSVSGNPGWLMFDAGAGLLSGTPPVAAGGSSSQVQVSADNGVGNAHVQNFTITVAAVISGGDGSGGGCALQPGSDRVSLTLLVALSLLLLAVRQSRPVRSA